MRMVRARTAMEERWRGSGRACRKSTERSLNAIFLEAGASRIHESVVLYRVRKGRVEVVHLTANI